MPNIHQQVSGSCQCAFLSCLKLVWNISAYLVTTAVLIAICILISTFSYIRIYSIVPRHQLQIRAQQEAMELFNVEQNLNVVRSKKSAINTFIYFILITLCYFPVLISLLILAFSLNNRTKVMVLGDTIVFMNSPLIQFCFAGMFVNFEQQF